MMERFGMLSVAQAVFALAVIGNVVVQVILIIKRLADDAEWQRLSEKRERVMRRYKTGGGL